MTLTCSNVQQIKPRPILHRNALLSRYYSILNPYHFLPMVGIALATHVSAWAAHALAMAGLGSTYLGLGSLCLGRGKPWQPWHSLGSTCLGLGSQCLGRGKLWQPWHSLAAHALALAAHAFLINEGWQWGTCRYLYPEHLPTTLHSSTRHSVVIVFED